MVDASIIIRPSSKDDSEGILDLVDVALVEDALFLSRYPKHLNHFATPEETRERRLRMIQAGYDNKRTRAFVAVTDTENGPGKIVGSVVWIAPADPNEPQSATDAEPEWPASADKDWVRKSTEAMQAMRERVCGEQKDDMWCKCDHRLTIQTAADCCWYRSGGFVYPSGHSASGDWSQASTMGCRKRRS